MPKTYLIFFQLSLTSAEEEGLLRLFIKKNDHLVFEIKIHRHKFRYVDSSKKSGVCKFLSFTSAYVLVQIKVAAIKLNQLHVLENLGEHLLVLLREKKAIGKAMCVESLR